MNKVLAFLYEVKAELEKITWPKRDELVGAVIIVSILSIFFAIILGVMDSAFGMLVKWFIS